MRRLQLGFLVLAIAATAGDAQAQGFFERLFGLAPDPAPRQQSAPSEGAPEEPQRRPAPPPVQARPTSMRVPTEDGLIGREIKQNGAAGSLRLERTGSSDLRARLTVVGRRSAAPTQSCSVSFGGAQGVRLTFLGRPDGAQSYKLEESGCALQLDILDEAVLIKRSGEVCHVQSAGCTVDAAGLWGPDPSQLVPRARDYEAARGVADKGVRENFKALVQRARPENVRPIVSEQASFSADREMVCRAYAREPSHSFCNARYSEARLMSLANRLGVTVASAQGPTTAAAMPAEPRMRRRSDPYGIPDTDDLVRGEPFSNRLESE